MTRRAFGGDAASMIVTVAAASGALIASRNATVTMWNAQSGGSQLTDLLAADGVTPITSVTALADGTLPQFFGPDGVGQLWANAPGAGERLLLLPTDANTTYVSRSTRRIAHVLNSPYGANTTGFTSTGFHQRCQLQLPFTPTRWRLRIANTNLLSGAALGAGIAIVGAYVGPATFDSTGVWTPAFASAATAVVPNGTNATVPSNGSDYVTAWQTTPLSADTPYTLSVVWSAATASICAGGTQWWSAAGTDASVLSPAGGSIAFQNGRLDIRVEYEVADAETIPVGVCLGDSITQGIVTAAPGAPPHQSYPGTVGMTRRAAVINLGVGSTGIGDWTTFTGPRWTRLDWATTVPDWALLQLGANDMATVALAAWQTAILSIIANLRTLGVKKIFLGTVLPQNLGASTAETNRLNYNAWVRTAPQGVEVVDFERVMLDYVNTGTTRCDQLLIGADQVHPTVAGYTRMASVVPVPLGRAVGS